LGGGGMTPDYLKFLASKAPKAMPAGVEPTVMPSHMFDYQAAATGFCIRQGRAALFLDTGLGKTVCELEFGRQTAAASNGWALILTPLAVARQIEAEGSRFGYDCRVIRDQSDAGPGINVCNYDRVDKLDHSAFGSVVLDESSILKSFTGATTRALTAAFVSTPFRLCATATPAPNDHTELGTHAEFLGIMPHADMLVRWFINDTSDTGTWRLKGHAAEKFWDWCASWAVMASSPDDLGFDGSRFVLPPLEIIRHKVSADINPSDGLFGFDVSATEIFKLKRQTANVRANAVARIVANEPTEPWLIWVDTDHEADAVLRLIPDAIDVRGAQSPERKEDGLMAFLTSGRPMVTKGKIAGQGLNYQHCARQAFVGRSFSYESWYQMVRRSWRFGQTRPVQVHLIVAEGEDQIGRVIDAKSEMHETMKASMRAASRRATAQTSAVKVIYNPTHTGRLPSWLSAA
jgi:hypothetical protein